MRIRSTFAVRSARSCASTVPTTPLPTGESKSVTGNSVSLRRGRGDRGRHGRGGLRREHGRGQHADRTHRQQRREVRAQLLAELLLLGRFPQIHRCFSYGIHGWQLLAWTLTRCPGGRCECLDEREAET